MYFGNTFVDQIFRPINENVRQSGDEEKPGELETIYKYKEKNILEDVKKGKLRQA